MNTVFLINGFIAGLIATVIMTIFQIPIWKKWGTTSILEWQISYLVSGIVLGFLLTLIVLIIHEPITKIKPLQHPLGKLPVLASFVTHAIYGTSLGYFLTFSDYFISVFLP